MFTSYIDLLYPTEDRNDRLRDSYFFTCQCQECTTKDKVGPGSGKGADHTLQLHLCVSGVPCLPRGRLLLQYF